MIFLFCLLSLALLSSLQGIQGYFSPPPSYSPELLFKVQGLLNTSSPPLSGRESGQGSRGQVFTVLLPDKVGAGSLLQSLRAGADKQQCQLPSARMAWILPGMRCLHLGWAPSRGGKGEGTAEDCTSQLINIIYSQWEEGKALNLICKVMQSLMQIILGSEWRVLEVWHVSYIGI